MTSRGVCSHMRRSAWLAVLTLAGATACQDPSQADLADSADVAGPDDVAAAADARGASDSPGGEGGDAVDDAGAGSRGGTADAIPALPDAVTADGAGSAAVDASGDLGGVGLASACTPTSDTAKGPSSGGGLKVLLATTRADATGSEPLTEGCALPLIFGQQGSYHLWASVCVPAAVEGAFALTITLRDLASGTPVKPTPASLKTPANDTVSVPGLRCRSAIPIFVHCGCHLAGAPASLRVAVAMIDPKAPKVMPTNPTLLGWAEVAITPTYVSGLCPLPGCP